MRLNNLYTAVESLAGLVLMNKEEPTIRNCDDSAQLQSARNNIKSSLNCKNVIYR